MTSDEKIVLQRFLRKRDEFFSQHEFKVDSELSLSTEQLCDMVKLNKIISVEISGKLMFPTFQFDSRGQVYEILQAHLPRLLNSGRAGWDICFWLFNEFAVVMKTVRADDKLLRGIDNLEEVLRIGAIAGRLEEVRSAMPVDLITTGDEEAFAAFVEQLLNPDYRDIPVKEVDWSAYFDVPGE